MADTIRDAQTTPFLAPEIVLLYKIKDPHATDVADLANVAAQMSEESREWLVAALQLSARGHPWIDRLHASRSLNITSFPVRQPQ